MWYHESMKLYPNFSLLETKEICTCDCEIDHKINIGGTQIAK